MDTVILEENQNGLEYFKDAIAEFASPKILDAQMENLKVLNKNLYECKQQKKETRAWLKENKQNEKYDEYSTFFKRYEKCYNKIQDFQKRFSKNTISLQLEDCKYLLTDCFEAKANLIAHTYSLAVLNFNADIHSKAIFVESKFQKGNINADNAYEHISRLQNSMNNPLSNNDENLKTLLGSYKADYATKAIFKNDGGNYLPDRVINQMSADLCKAENAANAELRSLMQEATNTILELNKKLDISKINNMLVDAQQFISTFGSNDWDDEKAKRFMDKFEVQSADLEKLVLEFENYQNKLSELIFEIQQKSEQTKQTDKQIAKIEAEKRLNLLIENIYAIKKLLKNNTPFEFLKQHFTILNNDYKEIETTLGTDITDIVMQKLGNVREELNNLDFSIKMAELQSIKENTDEKVLEYKPEFEDDGKPKN